MVTCAVCGNRFDRDKVQAVKVSARRYAHLTCQPDGEIVPLLDSKPKVKAEKEKTDEEKILDYITELFGKENINYGAVRRNLKDYREKYEYSDSGMLKSLHYWYDVKHNDPKKANGNIAIIPYVYAAARTYYYNIWQANKLNSALDISDYVPKVKEVHIKSPRVEVKKRKLFAFLDEEEEGNGQ